MTKAQFEALMDRILASPTLADGSPNPYYISREDANALIRASERATPGTRRTRDTFEGEYDSLLMDAVVNDQADAHATEAYHQIPTSSLVPALREIGWYEYAGKGAPRFQTEPNKRGIETAMRLHNLSWDAARDYLVRTGKHMITFRHKDFTPEKVGDHLIQSYLRNASNRTCPIDFNLGAYVLACMNGMMSQRAGFALSIAHNMRNLTVDRVVNAFLKLASHAPLMLEQIREYNSIVLTESQQHEFARQAMPLRWEKTFIDVDGKERDNTCVPTTGELIAYANQQQAAPTLWNTANNVQRNMLEGGYDRQSTRKNSTKTTTKVRSLNNMNAFVNINVGIDDLSHKWFQDLTGRALQQPEVVDVSYSVI